tara:strand:+ start:187 stop:390 length:204 start_codon:yes stop_codon:yes gene_type:complete
MSDNVKCPDGTMEEDHDGYDCNRELIVQRPTGGRRRTKKVVKPKRGKKSRKPKRGKKSRKSRGTKRR